jgi:alanine or glycine:cation symporter, AGCS family
LIGNAVFEYYLLLLEQVDQLFWTYFAAPTLLSFGMYLTLKSRWFQLTRFKQMVHLFKDLLSVPEQVGRGVPAVYAFFAGIAGCIGIGNLVGVAAAVQIGGPGAVFWMWCAALVGAMVKYAEIYISVKYRVANSHNSYDGGPMYYLQQVCTSKIPAYLFAICMCLYGVEIYIFRIVTHTFVTSWHVDHTAMVIFLLGAVLCAGSGGVKLVGRLSSIMIPLFLVVYSLIGMYILSIHAAQIPGILGTILDSAFSGHAAVGSFVGCSLARTISIGVQRACYTGDLGVGYAGILNSETSESNPAKQAAMSIVAIFLDTFIICSFSTLLILITGVWSMGIHESHVVAYAIAPYFPQITILWPVFIFLLGYSTMISYFSVGQKAAEFIYPAHGRILYFFYAFFVFSFFSYIGREYQMMVIMSIIQVPLTTLNIYGLLKLRKQIEFPKKF